jgi:protein involved in polysaccharide export with SLBB domain
LFVLILGIAIGLSLNLRTMQRFTGLAANESSMRTLPTYRIEPPDVLNVEVLAGSVGEAPLVSGAHLVGPDGTINLGAYGQIVIAGKTLSDAREAVQQAMAQYAEAPQVEVDVVSYNSKFYYVVNAGGGSGDQIQRIPVTGKETVLDALSQVGGRPWPDDSVVWIARPALSGAGMGTVLPVQWQEIVHEGDTTTNYQVLPGDRIFVAPAPVSVATDWLWSFFK